MRLYTYLITAKGAWLTEYRFTKGKLKPVKGKVWGSPAVRPEALNVEKKKNINDQITVITKAWETLLREKLKNEFWLTGTFGYRKDIFEDIK